MSYRIYMGTGDSPSLIDWGTVIATAASGLAVKAIGGLGLQPGVYWFGIRAVSEASVEETGTACVARLEIAPGGAAVAARPNPIRTARAEALAAGQARVRYFYESHGQAGIAARVRVAGGPTRLPAAGVDWATYLGTAALSGSRAGILALTGTWTHGTTLWLWARAETAAGVGGPAYELAPLVVRVTGPAGVDWLEAEEI
ncbi:MAG: hypothetical protein NTU93_07920 [Arthrobacter sp.]|nr:hypothetical protein [Arthrobacter sp.]